MSADEHTIVDGVFPLTSSTLEEVVDLIEFVVGDNIGGRCQQLADLVAVAWYQDAASSAARWLPCLDSFGARPSMSGPERRVLQEDLQLTLIPILRAAHDAVAQATVELYDEFNPPLSEGVIPLTQEVVDSYIDLTVFLTYVVDGEKTLIDRPAITAHLLAEYPKMAAADQVWLAVFPLQWAKVRLDWETLKPSAQKQYAINVRDALGGPPSSPSRDPLVNPHMVKQSAMTMGSVVRQVFGAIVQGAIASRAGERGTALSGEGDNNQAADAALLSEIIRARHETAMAINRNISY